MTEVEFPCLVKLTTILTNAKGLPEYWESNGEHGCTRYCSDLTDALTHLPMVDLVVIHCDPNLLLKLAFAMTVMPFVKKPLMASDLVLRVPRNPIERMVKKWLLSKVDHFILPFKDTSDYEKQFGINPERCSYAAGKPNIADYVRAKA